MNELYNVTPILEFKIDEASFLASFLATSFPEHPSSDIYIKLLTTKKLTVIRNCKTIKMHMNYILKKFKLVYNQRGYIILIDYEIHSKKIYGVIRKRRNSKFDNLANIARLMYE